MNNIYQQLQNQIDLLKTNDNYRKFVQVNVNNFPKATILHHEHEVTIWSTTDYLGMGHNETSKKNLLRSVEKYSSGTVGSRNIGGTSLIHNELEQEVANLHNKEAGIIFSSGFCANEGSLSCLARILKECVFISDEKNHASIISGLKMVVKNNRKIFKHNNVTDLENILKNIPLDIPKIIIFESVYSMDGSISPIQKIITLAKQYNALTYLDEVHAVGIYGTEGAGYAKLLGVSDQIDIIQGTFAKAYGVMGGYIVGRKTLTDAIKSFAGNFIFTTSMPPSIVANILANVRYLRSSNIEREKLQENVTQLRVLLHKHNLPLMTESATHILPLLIGDLAKAKKISKILLDQHNLYVQYINFPSVPKGTERLRLTITPDHNTDDINKLITGLVDVFQRIT